MQTISGLGICSLWCHHFARSWTQCIMEYHRWPYYWIYLCKVNTSYRQTYILQVCASIKYGGQTRNSVCHDFILLHDHFLDQTVKLKSFPLAMSSFSRTFQSYFWNNACMHVCWGFWEQLVHFRTHLDFFPVWTTHKVHCLTLTQEDELIDWYSLLSIQDCVVRPEVIRTTMSTLPKVAIKFVCALWE